MRRIELIRFTVKKASPSLPTFPANELELQTAQSRGYQTDSIPAEIILELIGGGTFDLAQLQILSHESKISSKIEVSVLEKSSEHFHLLGYLQFDDNSRSGFMARELQTVQIPSTNVVQVKLVCFQAYGNAQNPLGHIGIVGLNILGSRNASPQNAPNLSLTARVETPKPENVASSSTTLPSNIVSSLFQRADELKQQKQNAVSREAFDEAKAYRESELELRRLAELALDLEKSKQAAIQREDYEEAQRIKLKLSEILSTNSNPKTSLPAPSNLTTYGKASSLPTPPKSPPLPARKSTSIANQNPPVPAPEGPPDDFWGEFDPGNSLPVAESLEPNLSTSEEVQIMVEGLGLYSVRCLYSVNPKIRLAILKKLEKDVATENGTQDQALAVFLAAAIGLSDSNPEIFSSSAHILKELLERLSPDQIRAFDKFTHSLLQHLLDALSSSHPGIHDLAKSLFIRLASLLGTETGLEMIISKPLSKRSTLWRPLLARIQIVSKLISVNENLRAKDLPLLEWMNSTGIFATSNENVSEAAIELVGVLHRGSKNNLPIEAFLKNHLKPSVFELYLSNLTKLTKETSSKGLAQRDEYQEGNSSENKSVCPFCGKHDESFGISPDAIDFHMWRDCPMLGHCPHCNQVIEVSNLNEHLLEECEFRFNHKQCLRCGEAISAQAFDKHVSRNSCLIARPKEEASRCPLCHKDIPPFQDGWRRHLLHEGCPNNVRTEYT